MKTKGTNFRARISIYLLFCGLIVFWSFQVFSQDWTVEQKEVWESVQANWETFKKGDVEAALAMKHDDLVVWWGGETNTTSKDSLGPKYKSWFDYDKPQSYNLKPLNIKIYNNVAIVFYLYKWNGNVLQLSGRTLETWVKQDNKWLVTGSLNSSCDNLPTCDFDF